jgi:hypothetical protein
MGCVRVTQVVFSAHHAHPLVTAECWGGFSRSKGLSLRGTTVCGTRAAHMLATVLRLENARLLQAIGNLQPGINY